MYKHLIRKLAAKRPYHSKHLSLRTKSPVDLQTATVVHGNPDPRHC
jgi:hypothetical protein